MPSQFFGLTIASSGLSAYQAALNTTANNISNEQTKGYSRQAANLSASDALRVNAKYGSMGSGVTVNSIKQIRSEYYDTKAYSLDCVCTMDATGSCRDMVYWQVM